MLVGQIAEQMARFRNGTPPIDLNAARLGAIESYLTSQTAPPTQAATVQQPVDGQLLAPSQAVPSATTFTPFAPTTSPATLGEAILASHQQARQTNPPPDARLDMSQGLIPRR